LSITSCYQPPTRGPPLKAKGSLSIGYGSGGSDAFIYYIQEGQTVDVGFLKLFLTTEYVDFSNVPQGSPFDLPFEKRAARPQIINQPIWESIIVPVVQRKG